MIVFILRKILGKIEKQKENICENRDDFNFPSKIEHSEWVVVWFQGELKLPMEFRRGQWLSLLV